MTSDSLVPKPFDMRDAKRAREEAARLAERRDGATWQGVGSVGAAVKDETAAREELAAVTEAESAAIRQQVVDDAMAAAEAFIDVDAKLSALEGRYDGVITDAGQLGTRLSTAETELVAHGTRLSANDTAMTALTGTTLPKLRTDLDAAKAVLDPLSGKVAASESALATAEGHLTLLKDTTVPALSSDLAAATLRLNSAEGTLGPLPAKVSAAQTDLTTAFGQLGTVDSRITTAKTAAAADAKAKADAAQAAAIASAALTAQAKADTAEAAAKTAAAADAKAKADAAQLAAIAAAKTASDLSAAGAKAEAITAAAADAKTKADKALADAKVAAAADAAVKVAHAKADTLVLAANDAKAKADTAQVTAIAAAATDATAKAGQAKTDAIASATTMTNGIGKNLSSTAVPTVSNLAPQGSVWRRTDASGRIIGTWEQTAAGVAGTWTPRLITSDLIDNLDVGKLSSSTATINAAVINALAVQIATVIELNADRITAGKIASGQVDTTNLAAALATIISLNADRITTGTLGAARINVAELAASIATVISLNASRITAGTIDTARLNVTTLAASLATILSLNADRITAGTINVARLNTTAIAAATASIQTVDVKNLFATTGTMTEAVINKLWADVVLSRKVSAGMLEAELVLATKIIAGDPASTHAEMSPLGFKVFAAPAGGGSPTEVVRLGVAATDDYFAVTRADGSLAATISQDGAVSADQINANGTFWYKGDEMGVLLGKGNAGIVAAGYRSTFSANNAKRGNDIPYLRVEADLKLGRIYKVWTTPVTIGVDSGSSVVVAIRSNSGGLATTSSATITEAVARDDQEAVVLHELYALTSGSDRTVSFLLSLGVSGTGQGGFRASTSRPIRLVIEDLGAMSESTNIGVHLDGPVIPGPPPTPPPAVKNYVKEYGSSGSLNYQGNNGQYNWDAENMYQGLSPAGIGNLKSISIHPSMTADLSGATINFIRVIFNFSHWYYNAGGTARIGLHGHSSLPATFSGSGIAATSGGWPRPGTRWVDLPASTWAGFKSGAYKGVYLEGDGTYGTYGIASRPTIQIGYTK